MDVFFCTGTDTVQLNTINYYMCVRERDILNCFLILQISYL